MTSLAGIVVPPPTRWSPSCQPRVREVTEEVNAYFLKHWNFSTPEAEQTFLAAEFPRVTCQYFPLALDDRIHYACRLLSVLFLIDGQSPSGTSARHPTRPKLTSSGRHAGGDVLCGGRSV